MSTRSCGVSAKISKKGNRAFHRNEDVIDSTNPFPLIGTSVEKHVPFPSVSSHEKLDPTLIVPRQYTPKTDAKGRPLHERIDHSNSPSRSILVTTQGSIPLILMLLWALLRFKESYLPITTASGFIAPAPNVPPSLQK